MVNLGYWFRVVMMMGVLLAVLWTMRRLNQPHNPVETLIPGGGPATVTNLCPTRILWVETAHDSLHIEQEGSKWIRLLGGEQKQLDMIAVEKWFSRFCTVDFQPFAGTGETYEPALKIGYLAHKSTELLSQSKEGTFELRGLHFKSQALAQLINALPLLPLAVEPGNAPAH